MADFSGITGVQTPSDLAGIADANGIACGLAVDANGNGNCDPGFDPSTGVTATGTYADLLSSAPGATSTGVTYAGMGPGSSIIQTIIGALGGAAAGVTADQIGSMLTKLRGSPGTALMRIKGTHLNRSTYVTRKGGLKVVAKGTKAVRNRRSNAGNARAVRRAMRRVAMFDHLATKVEAQLRHVARRHVHHSRRSLRPRR